MGLQISVIIDVTSMHCLEHRRYLPVIHVLVVRMSRKHYGHASCIDMMGTADRRGYGGQQKGTICDAHGPYPSI